MRSPAAPAAAVTVPPTRPRTAAKSSAARALNLIGDRWSLLVLYACFLRVQRFDDFIRETGMARSLLANRLKRLEAVGILEKRPYQQAPVRHEYHLTAMGLDLYDTALMIVRWEKNWYYDPAAPIHGLVHRSCGESFTPEAACRHCEAPFTARDVRMEEGPGAGEEAGHSPRLQRRSTVDRLSPTELKPMLERSIEVLGDRWTSHVVAAAFYGCHKYKDFHDTLSIATNILAERLTRLCELGILERRLYQERPERWEYRLTDKGRDLFPLVVALIAWGQRWLSDPAGPPERLVHVPCAHTLEPYVRCDRCHAPLAPRDVALAASR
jgi:DNA-binding HxlR family transcriptional regulator